jgi:hypothetical protein
MTRLKCTLMVNFHNRFILGLKFLFYLYLNLLNSDDARDKKVILFASRGFSTVEQNYSKVENGAFCVVWACDTLKSI